MRYKYLILILFINMMIMSDENDLNEKKIVNEAIDNIEALHNLKNLIINLDIKYLKKNEDTQTMNTILFFKNFDENILLIKYPQKDKGKAILKKNNIYYMYFPSIRKTQPLNPSNKLFGDINSGDVLIPPFKENYNAVLLKTDKNQEIHIFEFNAKNNKVIYYKILQYYNYNKKILIKSEYYSKSDKLLKTAFYDEYMETNGELYYKKIRVESVLGHQSIMNYNSYKNIKINEQYFNPTGLALLSESF